MANGSLWIGTSWKMNKTRDEARQWASAMTTVAFSERLQPFVIPPFTSIAPVAEALAGSRLLVGAQNMHWAEAGAWTGEISAAMIRDCGATMVELGHSERRANFGETDETVALKVATALRHGLTPLICIGETAAEKADGRADEVLDHQVRMALSSVPADYRQSTVLLAYEPVWSIGEGGTPATAAYAGERHAAIARVAQETLGRPVPCLYGGSVNAGNCRDYVDQPGIDGLFIGRSAWQADGYLKIVGLCADACA
ncbi:triose-phosphate isomerase [Spiribacter onubensis]|uniref:Triosephosphate isomerase n=2 Tax=Spiribacter onubensis TaxID=3122420 RepID=A0ABV3S722_9GAMM